MDRYADDVRRLSIHHHWTDALRHVSLAHHHATLRGHAHPAGLSDALLLGKSLADLDEFLRLQDRIDQRMLGPEVEMFRKPVSRGDIRKLRRIPKCLPVVGKYPCRRVRLHLGMQGIRYWRFKRLVVFRE